MPPKIKVERTQILEAGLEIIRKEGAERLNARDLAKALECSVQPIFKNFESMEALKRELYDDAAELFQEAVEREAEKHGVPFLGKYLALIEFAN
ncbi:hypothetical protein SDC9_184174 [bioreactor metagenome]|uniref:HTH tetR-type domain-containing protein n=1 Tax=bioreactor metagenome TaxID=1076179 RepID=A0A645HKK4_9ZZZZ